MNEFINMCITSTVALIALVVFGIIAYAIVVYGPSIIKFIAGTIKWNMDRYRK